MHQKFRSSIPVFLVIVLFLTSCSKKESAPPLGKDSIALPDKLAEQSVPIYSVDLQSNPKDIVAGTKTTLTILPQTLDAGGQKVRVGIDQRSDFHIILIDSTFTYFEDLIAKQGPHGAYSATVTFPVGGNWTIIAEYQPAGANSTFSVNSLAVQGKLSMRQIPTADAWKASVDGVSIEMKPMGNKFITGALGMIDIIPQSKQVSIDTAMLQNMNGSKFHFFIVGEKSKEYFHSLPSFSNGTFMYHIFFTKADRYHGWLLFKTNDKVHTAPFTMNVQEGSKEEVDMMNTMHSGYHTGTGDSAHTK